MSDAAVEGAPSGRRSHFVVRAFSGPVVYRTVRAVNATTLWRASEPGYRWNPDFPAIYTSLAFEVSLAERLKHTAVRTVAIVVGIAHAAVTRVADLRDAASLRHFRVSSEDLMRDDYAEPHRITRSVYRTGAAGLLVPAAIGGIAQTHPRMRLTRERIRQTLQTPREGVNLVLYPDHFGKSDDLRELERFRAILSGLVK